MHPPTNHRGRPAPATRAVLVALVALAACTSSVPETVPGEDVGSQYASLLATPCSIDSSGNVTLTIDYGEIAYVGYQAGGVGHRQRDLQFGTV